MPIAATPAYLGQDFSHASPGLRFGMYLPLWGINRRTRELLWSTADIDYAVRGQQREEREIKVENKTFALQQACKLTPNDKATMAALAQRQSHTAQAAADVLTRDEQLLLRGYRTTNDTRPAQIQQRAAERAKVTRFMGEKSAQLKGFLSTLNYHANQAADGKSLTRDMDYLPRASTAAGKLLDLAQEHGLLTMDEAYSSITFTNQEAAKYLGGGWVEEYVFLKFTGTLAPTQYTLGAQITHSVSKTSNEIDGIAVANNRALIIECKAKKQDQAQDAIYKLGQLVKQVGGLMARGLYVSAKPVSDTDRARAREYGVDILAGDELATLSDYLRRWKDSEQA